MIRSSNAAKKNSKTATKVLVVVLFIGGIALAIKPSIKWIKGQLLHMEEAAHQDPSRSRTGAIGAQMYLSLTASANPITPTAKISGRIKLYLCYVSAWCRLFASAQK